MFPSYSGTGKVTSSSEFLKAKICIFEEVRPVLCENCPEPNFLTTHNCFFRAWKNDNVCNTVNTCIIRTVYPLMMYETLF